VMPKVGGGGGEGGGRGGGEGADPGEEGGGREWERGKNSLVRLRALFDY
jgi:hypothetical protein